MSSSRPLLRSLNPAVKLADAGVENARLAILHRLQSPPSSSMPALAAEPQMASSVSPLRQSTDAQAHASVPFSLPSHPAALCLTELTLDPSFFANHATTPIRPSEGRISSSTGTERPKPCEQELPSRINATHASLSEPGSPSRKSQRPASIFGGRGSSSDAMETIPDYQAAFRVDRHYHQSRVAPASIVTASANGRKAFFLDTLALVRRLEAEGLTAKQAEAITHVITDVLHESLESAAHTFVSKAEMQKSELVAEATLSRLKTEIQSSNDIRLASLQKEVEGLHTDVDKVKSELKYEVDKLTAGQRLDLNLERGRVKEELNLHAQEASNLSNKLDREVNALKAQLEANKFDVIRYCVGTLVSVSAVGLGMLRVLM